MRRTKRVVLISLCLFGLFHSETVSGQEQPRVGPEDIALGYVRGEILVQFMQNAQADTMEAAHRAVSASVLTTYPHSPRLFHVRVPGDLNTAIRAYKNNPAVEYAQKNYLYQIQGEPDDDYFWEQWGLNSDNDIDIDAPEAWDTTMGSSNFVVGIIDTGCNPNHPDLQGKITANSKNFTGGGDNAWQDWSAHSHGTHVAGIIAANANNAAGIAGVAPNTKIMVLKACELGCQTALIRAAMDHAAGEGVKVVNCSMAIRDYWHCPNPNHWWVWSNQPGTCTVLGCGAQLVSVFADDPDLTVQGGITQHPETLFVFAAGNFGESCEVSPSYPCSWDYSNIICVGGISQNGSLWDTQTPPGQEGAGSNWGVTRVDIAAPATDILSTVRTDAGYPQNDPSPLQLYAPDPSFGKMTGTSMAAPHVSGVIALMWSRHPSDTAARIKENLLLSAQPVAGGVLQGKTRSLGLLNADAAVDAFGDSFDDATDQTGFFSSEPTKSRWAVARNHPDILCDTQVKTVNGTDDRAVEARFNGVAGSFEAYWTSAVFTANYPPQDYVQAITLRVSIPSSDPQGTDLADKSGRIGTGLLNYVSKTASNCSGYDATFGASVIAGIELETGVAFVNFDPPFTTHYYDDDPADLIDLDNVKDVSIGIGLGVSSYIMRVTNSATGEELFRKDNVPYPTGWTIGGSNVKPGFLYYGVNPGSGTLFVNSFVTTQ
ncbi:MAG: hypothetical protein EHM61_02575 [Acidobacteria bacterium]|nr:MAG: hypothetical protein EHM61_02575 [Acidobacteriota bacterium]